jgi:hypothetical protein
MAPTRTALGIADRGRLKCDAAEESSLRVSVPGLGLRAHFKLDGTYDTPVEAASLGEESAGPPG